MGRPVMSMEDREKFVPETFMARVKQGLEADCSQQEKTGALIQEVLALCHQRRSLRLQGRVQLLIVLLTTPLAIIHAEKEI